MDEKLTIFDRERVTHYTDSIIYDLEKTVVYARIKGAQVMSALDLGVTIDQFAALDAIYCNNDICQRDLSKLLLKDRSNTGRLLNIIEKDGFIHREIETKGKRLVKKIYITDKGKALIEKFHPLLRAEFLKVFEDVSDEELSMLKRTLEKIRNNYSKTTIIQI